MRWFSQPHIIKHILCFQHRRLATEILKKLIYVNKKKTFADYNIGETEIEKIANMIYRPKGFVNNWGNGVVSVHECQILPSFTFIVLIGHL